MTNAENLIHIMECGKTKEVCDCIQALLDEGYTQERIVHECVMPALEAVGNRFENQELFIPQMLMSARAVNLGNEYLRAKMDAPGPFTPCKVVIGTVESDLHSIGKTLVAMNMRTMGIEVIDLGVDVTPEQFVAAVERDPSIAIVAISALLTTTMPAMRKTVKALKNCKAADRIQIMVGGGPVTEAYAKSIGADHYTNHAYEAAVLAKEILNRRTGNHACPDAPTDG